MRRVWERGRVRGGRGVRAVSGMEESNDWRVAIGGRQIADRSRGCAAHRAREDQISLGLGLGPGLGLGARVRARVRLTVPE